MRLDGGALLALVVAVLWGLVYLVTQVVTNPPLGPGSTVLIGVLLTAALIVGYPSALRGPRQAGTQGRRRSRGDTIALVGNRAPLRGGLTERSADRAVRLLRPVLGADAVAITDRHRVLAYIGPGRDHHGPGSPLMTEATRQVLSGSVTVVSRRKADLGCPQRGCPLRSAVVAPLCIRDRVAGTLKVCRVDDEIPPPDLVEGIAGILSLHLELADFDRERQLAADAKLDALRAQINPHFLFNVLNTIASRARTDPEEARQLLLRLSDFFRYSIRQEGHFADFGQEYFFVRTYLSLEQARFGDRLKVRYDVDPQVLGVQVPVLTIQPLVENAVKHGLQEKVGGGTVWLKARVDPLTRTTEIQVRDDGVGMDETTLQRLQDREARLDRDPGTHDTGLGGGMGLANIVARLDTLFGDRFRFDVSSKPSEGTTVDLRLPLR